MNKINDCIYCQKPVDPRRGQGDHIIPAAFGEFHGFLQFRQICRECNNEIGKCEQELIQCSPAGYFSKVLRPPSRRTRKRSTGYKAHIKGIPTPEFVLDRGEYYERIQPTLEGADTSRPFDQMIIYNANGTEFCVRLVPTISKESIIAAITRRAEGEIQKVRVLGSAAHFDTYVSLATSIWPGMNLDEGPIIQAGTYQIDGHIKFAMGEGCFRALAKIAFHYYLAYGRRGLRGNEPGFEPIRSFIRHGGIRDYFRRFFQASERRFGVPFGRVAGGAILPGDWCHLLAAHEAESVAVVKFWLFAGPKNCPTGISVTLGPLPSRLIIPDCVWGHVLQFADMPGHPNKAGRMHEVSISKWPPLLHRLGAQGAHWKSFWLPSERVAYPQTVQ